MPDGSIRKRRQNFNDAGHAHELTFCCYHRYPLLSKDRSRQWFIDSLDAARKKWDFELWAYVIMPEHVHVLIFPRSSSSDMSVIRKSIKQPVSRRAISYLEQCSHSWLQRLRVHEGGRTFHRFWQAGGGYDRNICVESTAWSSVNYIHNNPVRRGLVDHATDWVYSSARWYEGVNEVVLPMDGCPPAPRV